MEFKDSQKNADTKYYASMQDTFDSMNVIEYYNGKKPTFPSKPVISESGLTVERYLKVQEKVLFYKSHYSKDQNILAAFVVIPTAIYSFFPMLEAFDNDLISGIFAYLFFSFFFFHIFTNIFSWIKNMIINFRIFWIIGYRGYKRHQNKLSIYDQELHMYNQYLSVESRREAKDKERERDKRDRERIKKEFEERRKQHEYWTSLDPYIFEKEIAWLFEKQGYIAKTTKGSGDEGIDIHLKKVSGTNDKKGIVQCKRHKAKIGPAAIRDLYGTMVAGKYKFAYIVCPSGFSDKAYEFSKGKNIKLIGLKRIMEMVNS